MKSNKILTVEELNEIKYYAKNMGFEVDIRYNYGVFKIQFNESNSLKVYYDVINEIPYIEIHSNMLVLTSEEVDKCIVKLNQAKDIAMKLEGN